MTGLMVRRAATSELTAAEIEAIRALMWAAFADDEDGEFSEEDWAHSVGGTHLLLEIDGGIVAHASVVERVLEVDGRPLRTGYVEAVATRPGPRGEGIRVGGDGCRGRCHPRRVSSWVPWAPAGSRSMGAWAGSGGTDPRASAHRRRRRHARR